MVIVTFDAFGSREPPRKSQRRSFWSPKRSIRRAAFHFPSRSGFGSQPCKDDAVTRDAVTRECANSGHSPRVRPDGSNDPKRLVVGFHWTCLVTSTIIAVPKIGVGPWTLGLGCEASDSPDEANFRDNKIDADVLPQLTADDLKDIGVSAVGDRRRLLAAIAALSGPTPSVNAPASPPTPAPAGGLQISAERRPITVMFCDLVGSTSLAAKLDAEDWRNLVNAYLDQASAAVTDFGGHVLKKLGDGLMALFGYPKAQENDAERAVRAALAIQRALGELNARNAGKGAPALAARIGIESGQVVVDTTGEVFGEAPNVAARVQAAAEPGSVLVTGSVQRQVAGLFVVEEKGAHELKGVAQPLLLYRSRSRQRRRPKGRHARANAVRRPRGGTRPACAPLGASPGW